MNLAKFSQTLVFHHCFVPLYLLLFFKVIIDTIDDFANIKVKRASCKHD